ncbi:MAG TPA: hypothetical protein VFN36_06475 [Solirubrobacteraceae bacterium]|nr:hypothetical protein [Solirubrobacteraceae bacterium]
MRTVISSAVRRLAVIGCSLGLLGAAGGGVAHGATTGILPPRAPATNCGAAQGLLALATINACRAQENVGPLRLPSNWGALGPVDQGFILINLERVNRGLAPIVGLSASLDQLAVAGARAGADPTFPAAGFLGGGAIWAGAPSVLGADQLWMYDDGAGGGNLDCTGGGASGCWGHRDIILWDRAGPPLVAGGGVATSAGTASFAYIVLSGYSTANLTFSWARELRYFPTRPGLEPLGQSAHARHRHLAKRRHHRALARRRHRLRRHRRYASSPSTDAGPTITFG